MAANNPVVVGVRVQGLEDAAQLKIDVDQDKASALGVSPGDINTISEKWEGLSLVPVDDPAAPNDYFLFVGNDNDFQSATGKYMLADGTIANYNAGLENDSVVLAWRVQVVPEPGTYALMLAGLLGVAAVARRRHS